ncbi:MAG TPA: hypothetical protein VM165_12670, partial [Planctomycetaceae bacterium]|nr:hypothetical protein [Planctomycetaceae bacterium]
SGLRRVSRQRRGGIPMSATNTQQCPLCQSHAVTHLIDDKHQCRDCGQSLRLVTGSNGPTLVRHVRLPWEPSMAETAATA